MMNKTLLRRLERLEHRLLPESGAEQVLQIVFVTAHDGNAGEVVQQMEVRLCPVRGKPMGRRRYQV